MKPLHRIRTDWESSYRFFGGARALASCLTGTAAVCLGLRRQPEPSDRTVDCITFSVIPGLTALWATLFQHAVPGRAARIVIGDCSGGLYQWRYKGSNNNLTVIPLLNDLHGVKLDLFIRKVCTAKYVVVSDDDVFWLSDEPLAWALNVLRSDAKAAVVSLMPRSRTSTVLEGKVERPMGSYCLVIKRDLWLQEDLSFRIVNNAGTKEYDWFYDTADFAQVELLRRGYQVILAPPSARDHLVTLEAVSSWGINIRQKMGDLRPRMGSIPLRQEKAFRTVCALEELMRIVRHAGLEQEWPQFVPGRSLIRARELCQRALGPENVLEIEEHVRQTVRRVEARLYALREREQGVRDPA